MIDIIGMVPEGVQELDAEVALASDYNLLSNKPSINGVPLVGDVSSVDLGLGGDWELINSADFSADAVNSVEFLKDSSGADFSLAKFRLVYKLAAGSTINNGVVSVNDLPQNRNIGASVYVNYYYSNTDHPCAFEVLQSIDKIGTVSFNAYGGGVAWKQSQNIIFGVETPQHYAPFYRVFTSWGDPVTGVVELWGVRL